jgi:hypothetical protein
MELKEIDWGPMKQIMDSMALQLIVIMIQCTVAYILAYFLFRLIKIPSKVARFLGSIAVLFVFYFIFKYNFIPGLASNF